MPKYNHKKIENKWQKYWQENEVNKVDLKADKPYYCLDMFPYPSGEGLHVGHWSGYVYSDVWSRYKRLQGYQVLHPMGWDAFGLPAENAAIKNNTHPKEYTDKAISNFTRQLKEIGAMYDWDLEIKSSDPGYYKWTQWLFAKLFKKDLAYRKEAAVNFCPSCQTVLANEQIVDGRCERCGSEVVNKKLKQWFFKITDFSDQLVDDLDKLDWPEKVKKMQKNWIGRSPGAMVDFKVKNVDEVIEVFTTRPDTLFGATYLALAPENDLAKKIATGKQKEKVNEFINETLKLPLKERKRKEDKQGVFTGAYTRNPVSGKQIPIWVADYVLENYGSGAIMAVPAHDQRDFEFAQKYDLNIIEVISSDGKQHNLKEAYEGEGQLINSGKYDGISSKNAQNTIVKDLAKDNLAEFETNYKLKDWLISRQRYWGTPIPIIYCPKCGTVPVPEKKLPVKLPHLDDYRPDKSGRSPLSKLDSFVNTTCPKCGGKAKRETDTMDTFVDSSWYYLRYPNPNKKDRPFGRKKVKRWLPVDKYVGGVEHAVMHLLYARFITKALYKMNEIEFYEPFKSLFNQGMIYRKGKKMSKSVGNVISPDDLVKKYGRDALRGYELFIGPPDRDKEWKDSGIEGVSRFIDKVYQLIVNKKIKEAEIEKEQLNRQQVILNDLIENIDEDLASFKFNTIVSNLMKARNQLEKVDKLDLEITKQFVILLSPVFPHLAEELWQMLGGQPSVFDKSWPEAKKTEQVKDKKYLVVIQVNGKKRGKVKVLAQASNEQVIKQAEDIDSVVQAIGEKEVKKEIIVDRDDKKLPPKLVNLVAK